MVNRFIGHLVTNHGFTAPKFNDRGQIGVSCNFISVLKIPMLEYLSFFKKKLIPSGKLRTPKCSLAGNDLKLLSLWWL